MNLLLVEYQQKEIRSYKFQKLFYGNDTLLKIGFYNAVNEMDMCKSDFIKQPGLNAITFLILF